MQTFERPSTNGRSTGQVETLTVKLPPRPRWSWRALLAALAVVALIGTAIAVERVRAGGAVAYVTVPVAQQDLVQTVSATGTVNPQNTIAVGSQVSGIISAIDVDYNSQVHRGQVLARLDPTSLQAALDSAKASLAQAQDAAAAAQNAAAGSSANVGTAAAGAVAAAATARAAAATAQSDEAAIVAADANVTKAQSGLLLAGQTVARDKALIAPGYIAQSQVDNDASALVAAQTVLQSARAAAQQARAQAAATQAQAQASVAETVSQGSAVQSAREAAAGSAETANASTDAIGIQEAAVAQAQTNLEHTVITSPVDGTVIAREVSVGQTVAASLQTPTLFSIAQDLNKMEVDLAVGEPDIGSVRPGESVSFSVLAFPQRTFTGVVSQVRKDPVTTNNVVTYTTVVLVDNMDGALLPGMTANATIAVQKAAGALVVPLTALSYAPPFGGTTTHRRPAIGSAPSRGGATASPWGATLSSSDTTIVTGSSGRVFVERNGRLVRVPVQVTLISGTQAAVVPTGTGTLAPGDAVVIASNGGATVHAAPRTQNPLTGGGAGGGLRGIH